MRSRLAAKLFGVLTALAVAFQLALAAGAPWGRLAMSGRFPGTLPAPMRAAAVVQALVLVVVALIVAARAHLLFPRWYGASRKLVWVVVGFSLVSVVLNAMTPSPLERAVWLPVTCGLLICSLVVARGD